MSIEKAPSDASDVPSHAASAEKDAGSLDKRASASADAPELAKGADPAVESKLLHGPKLIGAFVGMMCVCARIRPS